MFGVRGKVKACNFVHNDEIWYVLFSSFSVFFFSYYMMYFNASQFGGGLTLPDFVPGFSIGYFFAISRIG